MGVLKSMQASRSEAESSAQHGVPVRQGRAGFAAGRGDAGPVAQQGGNLAVQRLLRSGAIHAKLNVSRPGDPAEQEADRIADQVMRMAEPGPVSSAPTTIQRACTACAAGAETCPSCTQDQELRRKANPGHGAQSDPAPPSSIPVLGSGGQPLTPSVRALFEPRFGRDFRQVRVHTDSAAAESARAIHARAYTFGPHIVFSREQYAPETREGERLLAHELTHVIQHGQANLLAEPGEFVAATKQAAAVAGTDGAVNRIARQPDDAADAGAPAPPQDAGATDADVAERPPDAPGGKRYSKQAGCVARRGGCITELAGGLVQPEEVTRYNSECRSDSAYAGPDITPTTEECRQYKTGEVLDPVAVKRFQALVFEYLARLDGGKLTLGDALRIDAALRRGYAALQRAGASLPELPAPITPPPDMSLAGPATLAGVGLAVGSQVTSAAPAGLLAGEALAGAAATAAEGAAAGTAATAGGTAAGSTVAVGGTAALSVGAVLIGVAALVGLGVVIYAILSYHEPTVDPTIPRALDEANETTQTLLDTAQEPRVAGKPLPDIGPLPHQRLEDYMLCTNEYRLKMLAEKDKWCNKPRSCTEQGSTCEQIMAAIAAGYGCISLREQIQLNCFRKDAPMYKTHMQQIGEAYAALRNCEEIWSKKCI